MSKDDVSLMSARMRKFSTTIILLLGIGTLGRASDSLPLVDQEAILRFEASMILGESPEIRKLGFDSLEHALTGFLSNPSSFSDSLVYLRSVSVLYGGSDFKVITMQCEETAEEYKHLGYLQTRDSTYFLRDASDGLSNPGTEECTADRWYGALYYHIEPFIQDESEHYLLLGYDGHSISSRRKLIEVLTFDGNGSPVFGKPVFRHPSTPDMRRFILQYSSEIGIRLNYDSALKMIVYDHLIPMKSLYEDGDIVMVSDGSYEGFKLKGESWTHVEKVFHEVNEGAPGEGLSEERKKLFKN